MGAMPPWYPLIRAAVYAGVPAWDLYERGQYWIDWYLIAQSAELEAEAGPQKS